MKFVTLTNYIPIGNEKVDFTDLKSKELIDNKPSYKLECDIRLYKEKKS